MKKYSKIFEVKCSHCQTIFFKSKSEYKKQCKRNSKPFCSQECVRAGQIKNKIQTTCTYCGDNISRLESEYNQSINHFCNHSCSAKFSNRSRAKPKFCSFCNKQLVNKGATKYCSVQCQADQRWQNTKETILKNGFDHTTNCKFAKRYLIEIGNNTCSICNGSEWQGHPMPLTLDHINGNSEDNTLTNLRVICPNCDRFTPFFGAKNRGNGRASRRQRYRDGKSY